MNKIVELLVDFENFPDEDLGVSIMSLVDMPAIGINWMAFAQENFVKPTPGEPEGEFISRCIPVVKGEGYPDDQAAAICYSYWETGFGTDTAGLTPYVDQVDEEKFQKDLLAEADKYGEIYDPYTAIYLEIEREEFLTIGEVLEGVQALDILSRSDIRRDAPAEIKYRYAGPRGQRFFCRGMLSLNKLYTREEINQISAATVALNPGMGHNSATYSVWNYKGGVNCRHYWQELAVFRNTSGQLILIDRGPASGDAGQTASPSNNFWRFSADDQMIVTGPAMVPNQLIPRRDKMGNLFHVYFGKETIRKIAEMYLKKYMHTTDINHDEEITEENTLLESWIVEDPEKDKSKALGYENIPKGTWFVSYKINNPDTWKKIKSGELTGFSVTGEFLQILANG